MINKNVKNLARGSPAPVRGNISIGHFIIKKIINEHLTKPK